MPSDEATPLLSAGVGVDSSGGSSNSSGANMATQEYSTSPDLEASGKDVQVQVQGRREIPWQSHGSPSRLDESDFVTVTEDRDLRRGLPYIWLVLRYYVFT